MGGSHVGSALGGFAAGFRGLANEDSYKASRASRMAQHIMREHDWVLQSNSAAKEIMSIDQQIIGADLRKAISDQELDRLSLTYKVLGDPNRLKIVMALRNVEMCVCDLAAYTGLTDSAVSHQLRRLKDLALVKSRRAGQIIYYSLDDEHVSEILKVGLGHIRE